MQLKLPENYDLAKTLWLAGMGKHDPCLRVDGQSAELAYNTPSGPVTVEAKKKAGSLFVECVGDGVSYVESRLAALFGLNDDPDSFQPGGRVANLIQQMPGVHLPTLPVVFHRLVQIVLQQLVTWPDALRGWRELTHRYGTDAPGSSGLRLGPTPQLLKTLGYYDLVGCGIMPKQARLILQLARESKTIERLATEDRDKLANRLLSMRGIGDWTVQHLLGSTCGDADAVLTGDFGLPHTVAWFLADRERSNDEEMIRLLEPYRDHRFRVVNLLWQSGITAPRRGPKMESNRWRFAHSRTRSD